MDGKLEAVVPFEWLVEYNGQSSPPLSSGRKRKGRTKKMEFLGWGSRPLIEFLDSIGKDTSKQISQYGVTDIISKYVNENSLVNPVKKKRINCDERLYSLFGKRTLGRNTIFNMLGPHFADNHEESEDDPLSEDEDITGYVPQKGLSTERKTPFKKKLLETPKSCFAAIIPDNIKLVYLKKSLVVDLVKDPETFEQKIVGSIVRIKTDPNDYLQKNSHWLLQVVGLKKVSGIDAMSTEILLEVSNLKKDIQISTLSDDNFSQEECEDLRQRVKDGLLKRPTVVELQAKALILHKDITKHWIAGELVLLQKRIEQANEKGWRKELFEHLERSELLQTPDEQSRLLSEVPKVIAEELEPEATQRDIQDNLEVIADEYELEAALQDDQDKLEVIADEFKLEAALQYDQDDMKHGKHDDYLKPIQRGASEIPICNVLANGTSPSLVPINTESPAIQAALPEPEQEIKIEIQLNGTVQEWEKQIISESNAVMNNVQIEERKMVQVTKEVQVIDLSDDDDEDEDKSGRNQNVDAVTHEWYYKDPQGDVRGPFALVLLKRWNDDQYFPADFKVWKVGQTQDKAVLLSHILRDVFH